MIFPHLSQSQSLVLSSQFTHTRKFKTSQYFLRESQTCSDIGIVTKGMCRHYYNTKDGEERMAKVCPMAKTYGAALVALTIDEKGMAKTREEKLRIIAVEMLRGPDHIAMRRVTGASGPLHPVRAACDKVAANAQRSVPAPSR